MAHTSAPRRATTQGIALANGTRIELGHLTATAERIKLSCGARGSAKRERGPVSCSAKLGSPTQAWPSTTESTTSSAGSANVLDARNTTSPMDRNSADEQDDLRSRNDPRRRPPWGPARQPLSSL